MEQKSYKPDLIMEIVNALLKGPNHVRGIARLLEANQMTVSRKMKELLEGNVVDYREEGRNKVYFLKATLEARNHIVVSENYKLVKMLVIYPELRKIAERIQGDRRIRLAALFGSYAKGLAKKGSDIDLYIETSDPEIKKEIEKSDSRLSVKIGPYDGKSPLIREIEKNHVIIKGAEEYYEKTRAVPQAD